MDPLSKLAIVGENHPLCSAGLEFLIEQALGLSSVVTCETFDEMVAALKQDRARVSLIVTDLDLPGMQGTAGLRRIVREWPAVHVLVTGHSCDPDLVLGVLAAGVHGYAWKSSSSAEMKEAIKTAASGHVYVPHALCGATDASRQIEMEPEARSHTHLLTARQEEVLLLLAAGHSNKQIARALSISEGTVKVHVNASFRALGVHNRVTAAAALRALRQPPDAHGSPTEAMSAPVRGLMLRH